MSTKATYSEVKVKVRRNALLLGEFTVAQLVEATGLNPESVRTEIQRLRKKGMIVSERKPKKRETLYRLSDDPEQRLALSRSIEAFYPEPPKPVLPRPTSRLYQAALQCLDQAERNVGRQREELLKRAEHQLEGAWQAEGARRAPELVQAYIIRERGRVACYQNRWEQAEEQLAQAKEAFAAAGLENEVRIIDEHLLYIEVCRRIEASCAISTEAKVRCILGALREAEYHIVSPLWRLLADLSGDLSRTIQGRVIKEAMTGEHRPTSKIDEVIAFLSGLYESISADIFSQEERDLQESFVAMTSLSSSAPSYGIYSHFKSKSLSSDQGGLLSKIDIEDIPLRD